MTALLQTVSTTGTLGSVENLMQHSYSLALLDTATTLENALGGPLPPNASTDDVYRGTERVFVATARQSLVWGEDLRVRASVLRYIPHRVWESVSPLNSVLYDCRFRRWFHCCLLPLVS